LTAVREFTFYKIIFRVTDPDKIRYASGPPIENSRGSEISEALYFLPKNPLTFIVIPTAKSTICHRQMVHDNKDDH
jgi:hypothetical protein